MGEAAHHQVAGIGVLAHFPWVGEQDKRDRAAQGWLGMADAVVLEPATGAGKGSTHIGDILSGWVYRRVWHTPWFLCNNAFMQ